MTERRFRIIDETGPKKHFEILKTLEDIEPIEEGGMVPASSDDLERIVEAPILEACKIFFEKGIRTVMSSANKKDIVSGQVYIIIDFDSLSDENKRIAERYAIPYTYREDTSIKLVLYVTPSTRVKAISEHMINVATTFKDQI